ncbi:MAG TPA: hypothetical protein VND54_14390 [Candidatus Saccharimonadales bacterium]|nr:hypothetical protein [Candidatus Saccharimonadales bacterium]
MGPPPGGLDRARPVGFDYITTLAARGARRAARRTERVVGSGASLLDDPEVARLYLGVAATPSVPHADLAIQQPLP